MEPSRKPSRLTDAEINQIVARLEQGAFRNYKVNRLLKTFEQGKKEGVKYDYSYKNNIIKISGIPGKEPVEVSLDAIKKKEHFSWLARAKYYCRSDKSKQRYRARLENLVRQITADEVKPAKKQKKVNKKLKPEPPSKVEEPEKKTVKLALRPIKVVNVDRAELFGKGELIWISQPLFRLGGQIDVYLPDGKETTIRELRNIIAASAGIPISEIQLLFESKGNELDDKLPKGKVDLIRMADLKNDLWFIRQVVQELSKQKAFEKNDYQTFDAIQNDVVSLTAPIFKGQMEKVDITQLTSCKADLKKIKEAGLRSDQPPETKQAFQRAIDAEIDLLDYACRQYEKVLALMVAKEIKAYENSLLSEVEKIPRDSCLPKDRPVITFRIDDGGKTVEKQFDKENLLKHLPVFQTLLEDMGADAKSEFTAHDLAYGDFEKKNISQFFGYLDALDHIEKYFDDSSEPNLIAAYLFAHHQNIPGMEALAAREILKRVTDKKWTDLPSLDPLKVYSGIGFALQGKLPSKVI